MLSAQHLLLLLGSLVAGTCFAADTDGTQFILAFANGNHDLYNKLTSASLIVMPIHNNSEIFYVFDNPSGPTVTHTNIDPRVTVTCSTPVKLLAKVGDKYNGWGDILNIPSIEMAGTNYIIQTPTSTFGDLAMALILPLELDVTVSLSIRIYMNDKLQLLKQVNVNSTLGEKQLTVGSFVDSNDASVNSTFVITASSPVVIQLISPLSSSSNNPKLCGVSCYRDYASMIVPPVVKATCGALLSHPDMRVLTSEYSLLMFIAPPNAQSCNEDFTFKVFDDIDPIIGTEFTVDSFGSSDVALSTRNQIGVVSYTAQLPATRFGGWVQEDGLTSYGHFLTYVPSTTEYVIGKTNFFTYATGCLLEIYISAKDNDLMTMKLDNVPFNSLDFDKKHLAMFDKAYVRFLINVTGYGLHSFKAEQKYVAYVICKQVNSAFDTVGYITGYNKRTLN
uniref:IgGFc_binding domain-containing protein n=1 Tax=Rhabditophanes sp. KR3021 TaxID=114890 RepID=A0AC35UCW5_9BILA